VNLIGILMSGATFTCRYASSAENGRALSAYRSQTDNVSLFLSLSEEKEFSATENSSSKYKMKV